MLSPRVYCGLSRSAGVCWVLLRSVEVCWGLLGSVEVC